jgi:Domain of unknown function (DUF932)
MNHFNVAESALPAYSHAFGHTLSIDELRSRTPAVFAGHASTRTKPSYRFINTADVLHALLEAGFEASAAQQTRPRRGSDPIYARHMIRLRSVRDSITLVDCIPEICLINAHDGTSAYLRWIVKCHHHEGNTSITRDPQHKSCKPFSKATW